MDEKIQALLEKYLYREDAVEFFLGRLAKLGFWPIHPKEPPNKWAILKNIWNRLELCTILVFVTGMCPITMYHSWEVDLLVTCEMAGCIFVMFLVVVHIVCLLYWGEGFETVFDTLEELKDLGRGQRECPQEAVDTKKWLTTVAMVYYDGAEVIRLFSTFAMPIYCFRRREFVLRFWLPYDYQPSPQFELSIAVMIIMFIYGIWIVIIVNALMLSLFAEITFQLTLLNHNIVNVVGNLNDTEGTTVEIPSSSKVLHCETVTEHNEKPVGIKLSNAERVHEVEVTFIAAAEQAMEIGNIENANVFYTDRLIPCAVEFNEELRKETLPKSFLTQDGAIEMAELRFENCIKHHQTITRLTDEIQTAFGMIIFYQFVCVLCPIIIATIIVLYSKVMDEKTYFIIGLMMAATAQQAFICYLAEQVIDESEGVRDAVIGCDWYGASEGFKRSMRIVMSRSNQPLVFNPLGLPVTMESFYDVLKLTYSFYTSVSATLGTSL